MEYEAVIAPPKTNGMSFDNRYMTAIAKDYEDAARYFESRLPDGYTIIQIRQILR